MKKIPLLVCLFISVVVFSQTDTTVWREIRKFETEDYIFQYPYSWSNTATFDPLKKEQFRCDFNGIGIRKMYLGVPLTADMNVLTFPIEDEDTLIKKFRSEIEAIPDRIYKYGTSIQEKKVRTMDGVEGKLYSTHYYRKNKAQHYSEYRFFVKSEKHRKVVQFSYWYTYKDSGYSCIEANKLESYMERIISLFSFRK